MNRNRQSLGLSNQQGAALIVALVILVVITMIGTASMRTSTIEMKMANSQRDRDSAFAAAEAGINAAESWLEINIPQREQLFNGCGATGNCFNSSCSDGLCFDGNYDVTMTGEIECEVGDVSGATQRVEFWKDSTLDVWNDANKHRVYKVESLVQDNGGNKNFKEVKYIVEFLCYGDPDDGVVFDATNFDAGQPLYRITALAEGESERAKVMLQATYMLVES